MCGIVGIWQRDGKAVDSETLLAATSCLRHRGPDDEGYALFDTRTRHAAQFGGGETAPGLNLPVLTAGHTENHSCDLAFGFRRLSILDTSPAGHQPMPSSDGRLWIVFNGEIYNYRELRSELAGCGYRFSTGTDTEVILAAYQQWGADCLRRFNGMWSLAIWDAYRRQLFCARDRFGIKPFYYRFDDRGFAFASEIKALLGLPGSRCQPNDAIIYDYLAHGRQDHTEQTFFAGIVQLPPAHSLNVSESGVDIRRYWALDLDHRASADPDTCSTSFRELFEDSIRLHLRSDVPIGTCLSGGLDSSSIAIFANKLLFSGDYTPKWEIGARQKTFSSCFEDRRFDERQYIEQVLASTGAEGNYTFPDPGNLIDELPRLIWHQDEPFGSTGIYAQWCVMKTAQARGIRVLLDGQGGDELLAGYHGCFDFYWAGLIREHRWGDLRREWAAYRARYGASTVTLLARTGRPFAPLPLLKIARRLKRGGSLGLNPAFAAAHSARELEFTDNSRDPFHELLRAAITSTSVPALLHYEDRNAMAHSIEARVPFLDHRLVEFVFSLPADQKIQNGLNKTILRRAFEGILPEPIRMRTDKMGFATPERIWLSHDLRDWIRDIFTSAAFRERTYFDVPQVIAALDAHDAGKRDVSFLAWRWANLELWLRDMVDGRW